MNDIDDILDLCRLNLMEENITNSSAIDRDTTLAAIDYKKRQLVERIKPGDLNTNAVDRHSERNGPDDFLLSIREAEQHRKRK